MKKNNASNFNSLIILYIYLNSYLSLLKFFFSDSLLFLVELTIYIVIFSISLMKNNFIIRKNTLILLFSVLFASIVNILITDEIGNVSTLAIRIVISSLVPLYLITQKLVTYHKILDSWLKFALFNTVLLPIFYYLRSHFIIEYIDIAEFTYLNCIILFYNLFLGKSKKIFSLLTLLPNFTLLLVAGSRMILIATIIVFLVILFLLNHSQTFRYYTSSLFGLLILGIIIFNLENILIIISNWLNAHNISSRNITLFLQYIKGAKFEDISSGRDGIYEIVTNYIYNTGGLPHGIGKVYSLTKGEYYHAHNIFLEMTLTFGIIITIVLIFLFLSKLFVYYQHRNINIYQFRFLMLIATPYFIRSLVGTYFLTDPLFLTVFSLMLTNLTKEKTDENLTNLVR